MHRSLFALLLLALAVTFTGCASTQDSRDSRDSERVSNIPWNRPERWEGAGPMGGMMNTM